MDKANQKTVWINTATHKRLKDMSDNQGIKMRVIVDRLINEGLDKYD